MADELRDNVPKFDQSSSGSGGEQVDITNWSAFTAGSFARSGLEIAVIILVAVGVVGGLELAIRGFGIEQYILPTPSAVAESLIFNFDLHLPHLLVTLQELLSGYLIGAIIGIFLAAVITQFPFAEKIIAPYIIIMVTTPMLALVPLLILQFGFGSTPRIIAVALASGPMVMINSATGFRRTELSKIALARSYGASTMQIFTKIRFPTALPMIIVGLMVGGIFGLLTAVAAELVGGDNGLGNRLAYYSSLIQMPHFFATIVLLSMIGVAIYVFFYWVGKKWASWQA